jgi:hypothetical protein
MMIRTIVTFGLIAGAILSILMVANISLLDRIGWGNAEIFGYTTIILSFLLVYLGVRSYRESNGGTITFGRAFAAGLGITLITCLCYVVTWEILYFNVGSIRENFAEQYSAYMLEQAKSSAASAEELKTQAEQMEKFRVLYENPLFNAAITFIEPFPIGLAMTLLSALALKRKPGKKPSSV